MRSEQFFRIQAVGILAVALALGACSERPGAPENASADGGCLPWVNFPVDMHSNAESPYLGCSNRMNLETQVAQPADLAAGRQLGPASGERESRAIEDYEQGKIKPFSSSSVAGPTIVMPGGSSGGQ